METYGGAARPSIAKAVIVGGVVGAILSVVPILSSGNFCCCLWYALAGVIAVLIYKAASTTGVTSGMGALLGLVTGLITGILSLIIEAFATRSQLTDEGIQTFKDQLVTELHNMPAQGPYASGGEMDNIVNWITNMSRGDLLSFIILVFVIIAVVGTIIAVIAGIVTAAITGRKHTPVDEPPPYQPTM